MFTGLVEEVGKVCLLEEISSGIRFTVEAPKCAGTAQTGHSIAVNGCCLTVIRSDGGRLTFDLLAETWRRTNFAKLESGSSVNLERSLAVDARLGGHFVSGHIDASLPISAWRPEGKDWVLEVSVPKEFRQWIVSKGSVAVDGISLTLAEVLPEGMRFWIIPHTRENTALQDRKVGDLVNIEFDLLAKYVEKILLCRQPEPTA